MREEVIVGVANRGQEEESMQEAVLIVTSSRAYIARVRWRIPGKSVSN